MLASNPCHTKCGMWSAVSTLLIVRHTIGDSSCTVDDTGSTRTICKDKHLINLVCKTALSEVPLHYNSAEEIKCETFLTWIISSPNRSVVSEIVMLQIWRYLWYSFFFLPETQKLSDSVIFYIQIGGVLWISLGNSLSFLTTGPLSWLCASRRLHPFSNDGNKSTR